MSAPRTSATRWPPTIVLEQPCQGSNPDDEVGARRAPVTPQACESGRPGSNGPRRGGARVLFRLSYVRLKHARVDSNQRPLPSQSSALSAELRAYGDVQIAGAYGVKVSHLPPTVGSGVCSHGGSFVPVRTAAITTRTAAMTSAGRSVTMKWVLPGALARMLFVERRARSGPSLNSAVKATTGRSPNVGDPRSRKSAASGGP